MNQPEMPKKKNNNKKKIETGNLKSHNLWVLFGTDRAFQVIFCHGKKLFHISRDNLRDYDLRLVPNIYCTTFEALEQQK